MKKVLTFLIILLFCIFLSFNLYSWQYYKDLNRIQEGFAPDFDELRERLNITDSKDLKMLDNIEHYMKFQQTLLFGEGDEDVVFSE